MSFNIDALVAQSHCIQHFLTQELYFLAVCGCSTFTILGNLAIYGSFQVQRALNSFLCHHSCTMMLEILTRINIEIT